jgi:hypothetical protein
LPNNLNDSNENFLLSLYEKIESINMIHFDEQAQVTPQIVNMTTNVDKTLDEIQITFSKLVEELINSRIDLLDKDTQLMGLRQQLRPSRSGSLSQMKKYSPLNESFDNEQQKLQLKILEQQQNGLKESEILIKEKETMLKEKEKEISNLENKLKQKEKYLSEKMKQLEYEETKFIKEKSDYEIKKIEMDNNLNKSPKQTPMPFTPAPSINPNFYLQTSNLDEKSNKANAVKAEGSLNTINASRLNNSVAANEEMNIKLNKMKENYEELDKKYRKETESYQKQIE